MLTLEQNITSVLETCFAGFKDELIKEAVKSILRLFDNQVGPPAFSANPCESCEHSTSIAGDAECYNCCGYYANNYKAKSTGSPIGDYRDGAGAWTPMPLGDPGSISDGTLLTALETWLNRNPDKQIRVDKRITRHGPVFTASIELVPWTIQKEE